MSKECDVPFALRFWFPSEPLKGYLKGESQHFLLKVSGWINEGTGSFKSQGQLSTRYLPGMLSMQIESVEDETPPKRHHLLYTMRSHSIKKRRQSDPQPQLRTS